MPENHPSLRRDGGDARPGSARAWAWPERAEGVFEEGDGDGVGPAEALEHVADGGVVDAGPLGDLAEAHAVGGGGEVAGEGLGGDGGGVVVGDGPVGPGAGDDVVGGATVAAAAGGHAETVAAPVDHSNERARVLEQSNTLGAAVAKRIAHYRTEQFSEHDRDHAEAFVKAAVAETAPVSVYAAKKLLAAVTGYVAWCIRKGADMPLDRAVVFDPALIERYAAEGLPDLTPSTAGNYRAMLRRVAEALPETAHLHAARTTLPASTPVTPYTAAEDTAILAWADSLPEGSTRWSVRAAVAACRGAGATAAELWGVRGTDVVSRGPAVAVTVGGANARTIVVLDRWAGTLAECADHAGDAWLFAPARTSDRTKQVNFYVERAARTCDVEGVQVQRMRATWMVDHLDRGTPLPVLRAAAGLKSLRSLDNYLRFATDRDDADEWLAGTKDAR